MSHLYLEQIEDYHRCRYNSICLYAIMSYIQYIENFNRSLKFLTKDLSKRYPNDAIVFRIQKRIMAAIAIDPLFVINAVGPYLYGYRDQIYAFDERFFLENAFDVELKSAVNQEKVDMVS